MESNQQATRLKKAIKYLKTQDTKLTNEKITELLGYKSRTYVSTLIGGQVQISDDFLDLLQEKFTVSARWIKTGEGSMMIEPNIEDELTAFLELPPNKYYILFAFLIRRLAAFESRYYGEDYRDRLKKLVKEAREFYQQGV